MDIPGCTVSVFEGNLLSLMMIILQIYFQSMGEIPLVRRVNNLLLHSLSDSELKAVFAPNAFLEQFQQLFVNQ